MIEKNFSGQKITLLDRCALFSDITLALQAHQDSTCRQSILASFRSFVTGQEQVLSSVPTRLLLSLACTFLAFAHFNMDLAYRSVTTYRSALWQPLFVTCEVDIRNMTSDHLLRGVFSARPPQRARPMPSWSVYLVISRSTFVWAIGYGRTFTLVAEDIVPSDIGYGLPYLLGLIFIWTVLTSRGPSIYAMCSWVPTQASYFSIHVFSFYHLKVS